MDSQLIISLAIAVVTLIGVGWFGLDRMRADIKADANAAHDAIGRNIETLRTEMKDDIKGLRTEISGMRTEIMDISTRLGRVEGFLELKTQEGSSS